MLEAWRPFWTSRAAVWAAGLLGVLWLGKAPGSEQYDPAGMTRPFSPFADLLLAPAARWDAVWYLSIADDGYGDSADKAKAAFYPLYPLLSKLAGFLTGSTVTGALLVSLGCFFAALVLLRTLADIELGPRDGRVAVLLVAFFPSAFFFSGIYSESLFLLLSVGALLAARRERWMWAGIAAALATVTRNSGAVLLVPLVLMHLYGPRGEGGGAAAAGGPWWRPRYAPGRELAWLLLVPAALAAYLGYIWVVLGDPFAPFSAQALWGRELMPLGAIWEGTRAAWLGLRQLVHGSTMPVYFDEAGGDSFVNAGQNLMLFGFLVFALVATAGVLRRLPIAYGAYVLVALALTLSYPVAAQPLMSLPRFVLVLFPLQMWLARWVGGRGDGGGERAIAICAVLLGLLTAQFARWGFVA